RWPRPVPAKEPASGAVWRRSPNRRRSHDWLDRGSSAPGGRARCFSPGSWGRLDVVIRDTSRVMFVAPTGSEPSSAFSLRGDLLPVELVAHGEPRELSHDE